MTIKNALFKRPITRLITLPRRRWYRSSSRSTRSGVINDDDDDSVGNNYYHPSAYATLRVHGPDAKGIVVSVSQVLDRYGAAITQSEHWTDVREGLFFQRVEFCPLTPAFGEDQKRGIQRDLSAGIGPRLRHCINWRERVPRVAVFVSRSSHCLWELLLRHEAGELECDVVAVISNHDTLRSVAEDTFGIPFYVFPITAATKESQEAEQLRLLQDELQVDLIVLARYMQVLSSYFLDRFPYDRILNIHHSFLPAFTGGSPYQQAYNRGVKLIGATAHYVTRELDAGPIVEQDVKDVSHRDTPALMKQKGRIVERNVLYRAVRAHLDDRVIPYHNRCVVFGD